MSALLSQQAVEGGGAFIPDNAGGSKREKRCRMPACCSPQKRSMACTGKMAAPSRAHVLLEAVAPVSHQARQSIETWGRVARGDHHRCQQQKLLAHGENAGDAAGNVECLAQGTRTGQHTGMPDESAGLSLMAKCVRHVIEPPGARAACRVVWELEVRNLRLPD